MINNAGYGHFGAIEEVTEDEARAQMETNFFGALWITQAAIVPPGLLAVLLVVDLRRSKR